MHPLHFDPAHYHYLTHISPFFQHLPEPNRPCLVGVYAVTLDPLLSLYGVIYVTWYTRLTKSYQRHIPVAFGIPDHVTYQTPTRHALLGSGRC